MNDYLVKKRRRELKRQLRLNKPWLMGDRLELEVDRRMGVADSGVMDWVMNIELGKTTSDYPTPESVHKEIESVAGEFGVRQWQLYWIFKKKVLKLEAGGRKKSDYLALLREIAMNFSNNKPLSDEEKALALVLFSKEVVKDDLSLDRARLLIELGEV